MQRGWAATGSWNLEVEEEGESPGLALRHGLAKLGVSGAFCTRLARIAYVVLERGWPSM